MTCVIKAQLDGKTSVLMFSLVTNSKHPLILVPFGLLVQKYKQYQTVSWACDGLSFGFRTAPLDQIISSPKPGSMIYTPFCGPKCTPSYSIRKYFKDVLTASFTSSLISPHLSCLSFYLLHATTLPSSSLLPTWHRPVALGHWLQILLWANLGGSLILVSWRKLGITLEWKCRCHSR